MSGVEVKSDGVFERFAEQVDNLPEWLPVIVRRQMAWLAPRAEKRMRISMKPNRYTGALEKSITHEFGDRGMTLMVFPTAKRGRWDGGLLLQEGTEPHRAPWKPIKKWAGFRKLPAFAIWYGIMQHGTAAHDFLEPTKAAMGKDIDRAAVNIVRQAAEKVALGVNT